MPRPISNISEYFTITPNNENIVVSSAEDFLNTKHFFYVDKSKGSTICSPQINSYDSIEKKFYESLRLQPTVLEPNIFYRIIHAETTFYRVELFELISDQFNPIKNIMTEIHDSFIVLNESLCVRKRKNIVDLLDLDQKNCILFSSTCFWVKGSIHAVVIDEIPYIIQQTLEGFKIVLITFANGVPILLEDNLLKDLCVKAIDYTPGDQHLIVQEEGYKICSVKDGKLLKTPIDIDIDLNEDIFEFVRIQGTIIPKPGCRSNYISVICDWWNFVLVNDIIYCSKLDISTGITYFHQIWDVRCLTILKNRSIFDYLHIAANQVFFDFYNNSVIIVHINTNSKMYNTHNIQRFYDIDSQKWHTGRFIKTQQNFQFYVDQVRVMTFPRAYSCARCRAAFNQRHFVVSYDLGHNLHDVWINGNYILNKSDIKGIFVSGNLVWIGSSDMVIVIKLDNITGGYVTKTIYEFDSYVMSDKGGILPNPYCHDEVLICLSMTWSGEILYFILRYDDESDCIHYILIENLTQCYETPIFFDVNAIIFGKIVYEYSSAALTNVFKANLYNDGVFGDVIYSPSPGVLVSHAREWINFCLEVKIFTLNKNYFNIEDRYINIKEFLLNCNVSICSTVSPIAT
ncbi:hypothetical protein PCE1_003084 [Barthelona sp. PCE]